MKYFFKIAFLFLLVTNNYSQEIKKSIELHLIQHAWHVGFLIKIDSVSISHIPVLNSFQKYKYIDVGWGDEDFYQNADINYYYGAKAMLIPTSSVIKITAHHSDKDSIIRWVEDSRKINISSDGYLRLLNYIESSFSKENGEYVETSRYSEGAIRFFKSHLKYYLFNTCNTWIAEGLRKAEFPIEDDVVITKDDLFELIDGVKQK